MVLESCSASKETDKSKHPISHGHVDKNSKESMELMHPFSNAIHTRSQPLCRVDLMDAKSNIFQNLGPSRQAHYWILLSQFLSFKLTKAELDVLLPKAIGRENVGLHNRFIKSILHNACSNEPPPPQPATYKAPKGLRKRSSLYQSAKLNESSLEGESAMENEAFLRGNGDAVAPHARKQRSPGLRERLEITKKRINRDAMSKKSGLTNGFIPGMESEEDSRGEGDEAIVPRPLKRNRLTDMRDSVGNEERLPYGHSPGRPSIEGIAHSGVMKGTTDFGEKQWSAAASNLATDREEGEKQLWFRREILPPFGLPFCKPSLGCSEWSIRQQDAHTMPIPERYIDCFSESCPSQLPDQHCLQRRMQHAAFLEGGVQAINEEAVKAMSAGLDSYLKRILKACVQLVTTKNREQNTAGGARSPNHEWKPIKSFDGIACDQEVNRSSSLEQQCVRLKDFMTLVELQPKLLGDGFAVHLERMALSL